ncbi:required for drug-induced death protein 1 [Tiliqua scincoides]|uniref:required for drug-induced death protein 1 n=1 Tax=Tiliqua scincoides TaxID=71010 RepID=UPI00346360C3
MATAVGEALRAKYARRGPADDQIAILPRDEDEGAEAKWPPAAQEASGCCASKQVAFAALPDKYEPLGRGGGRQEAPERKRGRRKRKLKKYGKNVGKVLQKGCRYLVLGLQGLANAYSSPFGVAVSVAAAFR